MWFDSAVYVVYGALFFLLRLLLKTFAFHIGNIFYYKPKYTALNHRDMITTFQALLLLALLIKVGSLKFFRIRNPPSSIS
jgi:hypothetical protein